MLELDTVNDSSTATVDVVTLKDTAAVDTSILVSTVCLTFLFLGEEAGEGVPLGESDDEAVEDKSPYVEKAFRSEVNNT